MKVWERWAPLTGIVSVVCSVYGTLLVLGQPQDTDSNEKIVTRIMNDQEFQDAAVREMARRVYDELRKGA